MLNVSAIFKPLTYFSKLCSIPEIPAEYDKTKINDLTHQGIYELWEKFEVEYINPHKELSGDWEQRYNMISLIEKVTIITIVILGLTHSEFATKLKRPVIIFDYSKIKVGVSVIAGVSTVKFIIKSIFIYHKRIYGAAQSRGSYIEKALTKKLSEQLSQIKTD